ncbi:MAG: hypothetical protein Kow0059_16990 [Candidatus Sumerlaeia bacterium]
MNNPQRWVAGLALAALSLTAPADTTIDAANKFAWGANVGWINFEGDVASGAAFGPHYAWGFVWSANVGWINLGDGSPADGLRYSNASAGDFGVNVDSAGDPAFAFLSGFAWGANIGWINFDVAAQAGEAYRPRIEKSTGTLMGWAWGANIGWISLNSSPAAIVKTDPGVFLNTPDGWMLR